MGDLNAYTYNADSTNNVSGLDSSTIFNDVYFPNENVGFVVGANGTILRTNNQGITWDILNSGTTKRLNSVYFINEEVGYTVGGSLVLKTVDNGDNWEILKSDFPGTVNDIIFTNENVGFVVTEVLYGTGNLDLMIIDSTRQNIYKTADAGENWSVVFSATDMSLRCLDFPSNNIGYAAGHNTFLKTNDGGNTWTSLDLNGSWTPIQHIQFLNNNFGYANMFGASIMKTEDGGMTWSGITTYVNTTSSPYSVMSFYFLSPDSGYVVGGNGFTSKTTDGGQSWALTLSDHKGFYSSIFFPTNKVGFAVGTNAYIRKIIN